MVQSVFFRDTLPKLLLPLLLVCLATACASSRQPAAEGEPVKVVGDDSVKDMTRLPAVPDAGSGTIVLPESDYRIGPADELHIDVFQVEELSGTEKVNSRGYIRMPLLGPVKVGGLTREQAEDLLSELYGESYLQDPQVNIDIVDYASRQVTVIGAVERPGVYPLKGQTTLLQALAMAGGMERLADEAEIVVFRTNASGEVIGYLVNLNEITAGDKRDPEVIGNDRVVVPESGSKSVIKGVTDTLRGFIGFRPY
ncbi:polysaccharide export protein [Pseudohalioglobus sediminis]|uniref:Polysaccharide export protein n=1 Tax=Pseudohalioglobus sediminis TaxID=2606449 RepID=A0A5B0WSU9_9GAMM|nr:polysaccharide biosynthesis/export family protein [Pseudohalioglobus sediminis]KAA1188919.1 polysaccharide export protein [Pseudohalioglobus sediminis]